MRKNIIWSFSKESIQKAFNESSSYTQMFEYLNLPLTKNLIKVLDYRVKVEDIDKSQFNINKTVAKKTKKVTNMFEGYNLKDILVENSSYYNSHGLKNKLLKSNILKYECQICAIKEWNGQELSLQLDHINGKSNDNRLENLRFLCPNCHSQTETYAGKKKKEKTFTFLKNCQICKASVNNRVFCEKCTDDFARKRRKVNRPPYEEIKAFLGKNSYCAAGKKYGVSDNAVRKWLKYYEKII